MSNPFTQEYVDEWQELARPLEELTGVTHTAFDPGVVFCHGKKSVTLPRWLLELINEGLKRERMKRNG